MGPRSAFRRRLAQQLGHPRGLAGRIVARRIDERNVKAVDAPVAALEIAGGQVVADVGFGGGIGLAALLKSPAATVHGAEISEDMLRAARKTYRNGVLRAGGQVVQQLDAAGLTPADHRRLGPADGPAHLRVFHVLIVT